MARRKKVDRNDPNRVKRKYVRRKPLNSAIGTAIGVSPEIGSDESIKNMLEAVKTINSQATINVTADIRRRVTMIALQALLTNLESVRWSDSLIAARCVGIANEIVVRLNETQISATPVQLNTRIALEQNGHPDEQLSHVHEVAVAVPSTVGPSVEA